MKKALALIAILLCIQCSNKLVVQHKKNGIVTEKINLKAVNRLLNDDTEVANISRMVDATGQENLVIRDNNNGKEVITSIVRHKDKLNTLSTRSTEGNIEEVKIYYLDTGYLKSKAKFIQQTTKEYNEFTIGIGERGIRNEYYDKEGLLIQQLNFDEIYSYTFETVFQDLIQNLKPYYSYSIGMYYLNTTIYPDICAEIKKDLSNKGIDIKFDHPYWVITDVQQDLGFNYTQETTYIDGVTGDLIGETTFKFKKANH